jgi:hypothetical protein
MSPAPSLSAIGRPRRAIGSPAKHSLQRALGGGRDRTKRKSCAVVQLEQLQDRSSRAEERTLFGSCVCLGRKVKRAETRNRKKKMAAECNARGFAHTSTSFAQSRRRFLARSLANKRTTCAIDTPRSDLQGIATRTRIVTRFTPPARPPLSSPLRNSSPSSPSPKSVNNARRSLGALARDAGLGRLGPVPRSRRTGLRSLPVRPEQ